MKNRMWPGKSDRHFCLDSQCFLIAMTSSRLMIRDAHLPPMLPLTRKLRIEDAPLERFGLVVVDAVLFGAVQLQEVCEKQVALVVRAFCEGRQDSQI